MPRGLGPKSIELILSLRRGPKLTIQWPSSRLLTKLIGQGFIHTVGHPTVRLAGEPAPAYALTQAGEELAQELGPRGEGHRRLNRP